MKSIYTLAMIAALSIVSARADDVIGSPKYQEQNRRPLTGGAEATQKFEYQGGKALYARHSAVTNGMTDRNLVREQRDVVYTGKNPLRDQQKQFEIAPMK